MIFDMSLVVLGSAEVFGSFFFAPTLFAPKFGFKTLNLKLWKLNPKSGVSGSHIGGNVIWDMSLVVFGSAEILGSFFFAPTFFAPKLRFNTLNLKFWKLNPKSGVSGSQMGEA